MLTPGTKLGPYEVLGSLGAGGMGEVYRARDTRLDRQVAIKILPDTLAADPQFRERFDREARVISQLTHPHICTLYDVGDQDGTAFLVMEFLDGETLADRLARVSKTGNPGLPIDETLQIAIQIADALDKAHRAGVVHRDLKPGNIMLTRTGSGSKGATHAKLLDFGLAKTGASSPALAGASMLATTPPNLTAQGTILGTFHYMAPEQLEGGEADARTDIFAFGLIVYEMVTGRKVFEGKSQAALIAAILERPPAAMSSGDRPVPHALENIVQGCLAKDPDDRWQTARDVVRQLKGVAPSTMPATDDRSSIGDDAKAIPSRKPTASRLLGLTLAVLVGAALASGYWVIRTRSSNSAPLSPMHLSVGLAPGAVTSAGHLGDNVFSISPDGRWIVFPVVRDGRRQLFRRAIGQSSGRPIDGSDGAERAFFSPDSKWIAFFAQGALKKLPISGGSPIVVCALSSTGGFSTGFLGASWGTNDRIVFIPQFNAGIWSVSASGGEPQLLLAADEAKDRIAYIYPQALPDSKGVLVAVVSNRATSAEELDIAVLPAGATEPRILIRGGTNGQYVASGHLVYARGDALLAVAFDLSRLDVIGTPVPIIEGAQRGPLGDVLYSVSDNGTLLYEPTGGTGGRTTLVVVDRKGAVRSIADGPGLLQELSASPDGRSVAARVAAQNDDVWTYDIGRGSPLRLTFEPGDEISPQWTPDGTRIAFGSRVGRVFWKSTDGAGQREEISRGEFPRLPTSFSPDGKTLAFVELHPDRKRDILLMPLDGARKPEPFQATDADEWAAKFSPDGRWIAYVSNESGRDDVYVRPIGVPGGRRRISSDGGTEPVWARSGRELFFLKGGHVMGVKIDAQGNLADAERMVLQAPKLNDLEFQSDSPYYDVLPDGEHFVMLLSPKYVSPTHYNLVINWFDEIRQKIPAGR